MNRSEGPSAPRTGLTIPGGRPDAAAAEAERQAELIRAYLAGYAAAALEVGELLDPATHRILSSKVNGFYQHLRERWSHRAGKSLIQRGATTPKES